MAGTARKATPGALADRVRVLVPAESTAADRASAEPFIARADPIDPPTGLEPPKRGPAASRNRTKHAVQHQCWRPRPSTLSGCYCIATVIGYASATLPAAQRRPHRA